MQRKALKYTQSISKSLLECTAKSSAQLVKSKERTQPYVTETEARRLTNQEFKRRRLYLPVLRTALLIAICFLIVSCGSEQCYQDPDFSQQFPSIQKTKTFSVYPTSDSWLDTGIDITNSNLANPSSDINTAIISVNGQLTLCHTQNSPNSLNYVTMCKATKDSHGKTVYLTNLCTNTSAEPGDYSSYCSQAITVSDLPCPSGQENLVCDSGTLLAQQGCVYGPDGRCIEAGPWVAQQSACSSGLLCSGGKISYINPHLDPTQAPTNPPINPYIQIPNTTCTSQPYTSHPLGASQTWTVITDDQGIRPGDIVTLSVGAPQSAPLPTVSRFRECPSVSNPYWNMIAEQTYYPAVQGYKGTLPPSCPNEVGYNTSVDGCPLFSQSPPNNLIVNCFNYDTAMNGPCVWMTFGTGLHLGSDEECGGGDNYHDFTNNAFTQYGPYTPLFSISDSSNPTPTQIGGSRTFLQKDRPIKKLCAGSFGTAGGYILNVTVQSCLAINGHPSPAWPDTQPKLGALLYTFDTTQEGTILPGFSDPAYQDQSSVSDTVKITNTTSEPVRLYLKIAAPNINRPQSTGSYTVQVIYKEPSVQAPISGIIEEIKNFIKSILFDNASDGTASPIQSYFNKLKNNANYSRYISILLTLYILLYALTFLTGNIQISQMDLLVRMIKIGIVLGLLSDNSWAFFHDYFFQVFIDGTDALIKEFAVSTCTPGPCATFSFVDSTLALLLTTTNTWLKILALIFISPLGILIVLLVVVGIFYFLVGVFSAVVAYLLCILAIGILISLAPIFIPFSLFSFTKYLFDQWWQMLARYALEPVLLIFGLQVLVQIFYLTLTQMINFTVCWKCAWALNLNFDPIGGLLDGAHITKTLCLPFFGPFGVFPGGGGASFLGQFSGSLANGLILVIIALVIKQYNSFVNDIMDGFIERKTSPDYGKGARGSASHDDFVSSKLGVKKLESNISQWTSSKARGSIKSLTGLEMKTQGEKEQEKKQEQEKYKRQGMRMLTSGMLDIDKGQINKALENALDTKESIAALRGLGKTTSAAQTAKAGQQMFTNLAKNEVSYQAFAKGLSKLSSMNADQLNKLPQGSALKDLHTCLQQSSVKSYMSDLTSKNGTLRAAAQSSIGTALCGHPEVAKSLANREARTAVVDGLLKLARTKD